MKLNSKDTEENSSVSKLTIIKQSLSSPPPTLSYPKESQIEGVECTGRSNSLIINKLRKGGRYLEC